MVSEALHSDVSGGFLGDAEGMHWRTLAHLWRNCRGLRQLMKLAAGLSHDDPGSVSRGVCPNDDGPMDENSCNLRGAARSEARTRAAARPEAGP